MSISAQDLQEVRAALEQINATWLMADPERIAQVLAPHFDEQSTIVGPGFVTMASGQPACVASYVDFKRQAQIHSCTFTTPVIHIAADTAVVTNAWDIAYTMGGTRYQETGHDIYVFARRSDAWRVIWRAMLPS